ncbi:SecDF P1 head subdomain-containing protein [Microbispora sp. CA-135349]|uniref:SecDF P1 head subdomain-containing protein n=1 Tax=Microbispora sp. CA-135349 TaxID=3239953 RepID=UPI003D8F21BD
MHNAPVSGDEEPGPWPGGPASGAETAPMPKQAVPEERGGMPAETSGGYDWFGGTRGGPAAVEETSVLPGVADVGPSDPYGGPGDPLSGPAGPPREPGGPGDPLGVPGGSGEYGDPLGVPREPDGLGDPLADPLGVPGEPTGPLGVPGEPGPLGVPGDPDAFVAIPPVEPVEPVPPAVPDGVPPGVEAAPGVVVPDGTAGPGDGPPASTGPVEPRAARGTTITLVVALVLVVVMSGVLGAVAVLMTRNPDAPPLAKTPVRTLLTSVHFAPVNGVGPAPCTGTDAIPDDKGSSCYQLDPGVTVTTVQKIEEVPDSDGTYSIRLVLSPSSREQIAALTRETVKQQLAIVVGEKVVAAPRVAQEITQDSLGIAGFDKAQADAIMALLTGSAPAGQQNPAVSPSAPAAGQPGGTQPDGTQQGGTQPGGTQPDGTQQGGTQPGGSQPGGSQPGGTQPGGTQPGGTQQGGTQQGGTQQGGTQQGGQETFG